MITFDRKPGFFHPPILEVQNLYKTFPLRRRRGAAGRGDGRLIAVDNVSFHIHEAETLGIVGESGCGKSTLARCMLNLIEPTSGKIVYQGWNLLDSTAAEMRKLRRHLQIVFQDPATSLNPRMKVGRILAEPIELHRLARRGELRRKVESLLERVGLPATAADRYPHAFSGGQRQRIAIARALACQPRLIVCDEPTSALDVSVQARILNLLKDLQDQLGISYLFISHDIAVVAQMCDRIAVMKEGRIIEIGDTHSIISSPQQPYTRTLLDAVPRALAPGTSASARPANGASTRDDGKTIKHDGTRRGQANDAPTVTTLDRQAKTKAPGTDGQDHATHHKEKRKQ